MSEVIRYIGARYVPVFADPVEWDNTLTYEPLTIVTYQGASYTSKQAVPVGIEITNDDYWVATGNYNAQVDAYRRDVQAFDGRITANANAIAEETANRETEDASISEHIDNDIVPTIQAAQATADAAQTAADEAQSSADSAADDAATAQSTANGNTAAIGNLQTQITEQASEIDVLRSVMPPAQSQSVPYMSPAYVGDYESRYQSACVCKDGNLIYCFNATNYDDTGTLKVANLITNAAPTDMISHPVVGHANSCCIIPAHLDGTDTVPAVLYLAKLYQYSAGTRQTDLTIKKYTLSADGTSVASVTDIAMPAPIMAVSYDHVTGALWAFTGGSSLAANQICEHTVYRKQADSDIFDLMGVIRYENPVLKTDTDTVTRVLPQDFAVKDNIAFFCFNDGSGYTFDMRDVIADGTASPLACFRIGYISNSGIWQFGEVEGWEFDSDGALYQMRDCVLNIQESDSYTGQDNVSLRFSVVTSLAVGAKVQTDMSSDFGSYETVNISGDVQQRFSLTGSQIRSLNSLLLRVVPPCKVSVYGTVVESHTVRIVDDLNLAINTNSYQVGHIYHVSGRLQIFIQAGGELIVNRVAGQNFIDGGTQSTELLISNRGTITIRNAIAHFYDFGYACAKLAVLQYGTITSGRFTWGDLTIANRGFWIGNHQIANWT